MAIGGESGYLTINPTENYVGQAIQNASDSFARVRAEKIAQERDRMINEQNEREQRRQDAKDAMEINEKYPYAFLGDTDKQFVVDLKKTYTDAMRDHINTGSEKSAALADKALININRLNERKKAMSIKAEEMLKNEQDYNPTSFNKVKEVVARANKDLITRLDENGNLVNDLVKRDDNGVVIGYDKKGLTDFELKQMFEIVPKFNITGDKGLVSQFKKDLRKIEDKVDIVRTPKGEMKRITNGYEGYEDTAAVTAKELLKNKSAVYTALETLGADPENNDNYTNKDVLDKVETYYKNILLDSAKPVVSEIPYLERDEFNNKVKQQNIDNDIARQNLKLSKQRLDQENSTVVYEDEELTPQGLREKAAFEKKYPGVPMEKKYYTPGAIKTKKTTEKTKSNPNAKPAPAKKEINRSEIASKAKAAGYSVKEYEALLIKNGVTIK